MFDLNFWIVDLKRSFIGDANLNGESRTGDLVNVFVSGEYEDVVALNSTWSTGDWNADGDFTTRDLLAAFQDGGFEKGPRTVQQVPEPRAIGLIRIGVVVGFLGRKRNTPTFVAKPCFD